jgi:hypothetical protein
MRQHCFLANANSLKGWAVVNSSVLPSVRQPTQRSAHDRPARCGECDQYIAAAPFPRLCRDTATTGGTAAFLRAINHLLVIVVPGFCPLSANAHRLPGNGRRLCWAEIADRAERQQRLPDRNHQAVRRRPAKGMGLVHRSDLGSHYLSIKYTTRLGKSGIEPSVGSVGDSYDNALAKIISGLFKAGAIHRRGLWRSLETVDCTTLEWVD